MNAIETVEIAIIKKRVRRMRILYATHKTFRQTQFEKLKCANGKLEKECNYKHEKLKCKA